MPLEKGEIDLCLSCEAFIDWKYGSLENYQNALTEAFESETEDDIE